jgi:hypothetical protein
VRLTLVLRLKLTMVLEELEDERMFTKLKFPI